MTSSEIRPGQSYQRSGHQRPYVPCVSGHPVQRRGSHMDLPWETSARKGRNRFVPKQKVQIFGETVILGNIRSSTAGEPKPSGGKSLAASLFEQAKAPPTKPVDRNQIDLTIHPEVQVTTSTATTNKSADAPVATKARKAWNGVFIAGTCIASILGLRSDNEPRPSLQNVLNGQKTDATVLQGDKGFSGLARPCQDELQQQTCINACQMCLDGKGNLNSDGDCTCSMNGSVIDASSTKDKPACKSDASSGTTSVPSGGSTGIISGGGSGSTGNTAGENSTTNSKPSGDHLRDAVNRALAPLVELFTGQTNSTSGESSSNSHKTQPTQVPNTPTPQPTIVQSGDQVTVPQNSHTPETPSQSTSLPGWVGELMCILAPTSIGILFWMAISDNRGAAAVRDLAGDGIGATLAAASDGVDGAFELPKPKPKPKPSATVSRRADNTSKPAKKTPAQNNTQDNPSTQLQRRDLPSWSTLNQQTVVRGSRPVQQTDNPQSSDAVTIERYKVIQRVLELAKARTELKTAKKKADAIESASADATLRHLTSRNPRE